MSYCQRVNNLSTLRDGETLGRGIAFQYAYFATLTLSGAAFYLYVIHIFPPSLVGSVALLIAILSLFPITFSFGLQYGWQHFTSYEIGTGNSDGVGSIARKAVRIGIILSIVSVATLIVTANAISFLFFHSYAYVNLVYMLALDIPSAIMISFLNSIMLGLQNFRKSGIIGMTYVVVVYAISIAGLHITHSIYSIPVGWGAGYFIGVMLFYMDIRARTRSISKTKFELRPIFSYSLPLYITGILSYGAAYIDRLTVAYLKDLASIGVYNLALLIASGTSILSSPLGGIIFSKFSEFHGRKDSEMIREGVRISSNAAAILYVPAALGISAISVPVIKLLAGSGYVQGALPLSIILTINAVFIIGGPIGNAMQGTRKTHVFIISTGLALLSNLILSFTLIPSLSLIGAAIAYSSTGVVSFAVIYAFAREAALVRLDARFLSRLWLSAGVMALAVYLIASVTKYQPLLLPIYVIAGFSVYVAMIHITSALREEDKSLIASLIPKRLKILRKFVLLL